MEEVDIREFRKFYNHKDSANVFLWSVILPYLVSFFAIFVLMFVAQKTGSDIKTLSESLPFLIVSAILTPLVFLGIFLVYNKTKRISFSASRTKFNLNYKTILILIAVSLICVFGIQYFIGGINIGLETIGYKLSNIDLPLTNGWWYVLNIFLLAFLPAVCEELIFRGVIFNGLRKNTKDITAVLISALLFALMHGRLEQLVYPFILGIILGVVVLRTKSVVASMIVHFCNNLIVVTLTFVEKMKGFNFMPSSVWLFWVLAVVLLFVTFGLLFIIDKFYFKKHQKEDGEEYQKDQSEKVPNIVMIIGISVAAIMFIINTVLAFTN